MAPHTPVVDLFHRLYSERYGVAPTWSGQMVARLKRLIGEHGIVEVNRRIEILFTDAPAWINEPYTVPLLCGVFDALAIPASAVARKKAGLSGDDLRTLAARLGDSDETE